MQATFEAILAAKVYQVAKQTPLEKAQVLSNRYDNNIYIKREDLQPVHSFKLRGAFNKIKSLTKEQLKKGIITVSAGNHAQGVALSAKFLKINATIVMPVTTPEIKVTSVKSYGVKVIKYGDDYDSAKERALELAKEKNLILIPPFDDLAVIGGQGTIAVEILNQHPEPIDIIFVPIGGGGLIAGVATYIKTISPKTKVIGVEPEDAASMYQSIKNDKIVSLGHVGIFADGAAVRRVGDLTFDIVRQTVDDIVLVSIDEICAAIKEIFEDNRSVAEPAGALAMAGLKKYIEQHNLSNKEIVVIESGANINFDRLRHVAERADIGEKKEIVFAATIDEQKGSFKKFCHLLGKRRITEFNYRYADPDRAHVFVGIEASDDEILLKLKNNNIPVQDLTNNEMAKQHVRYMVGGRPPKINDEVIYRFQFPERPGALLDFLTHTGARWNISLFHYRNHGAAFGRVLVGIQVPENEIEELELHFSKLKYEYRKESRNPAYELFLS